MSKINKGSVLVFSLIIMGIILIAAIGIAAVSVTEQKNVGTTAKSTQSFQVASSASELLLQQVKNNPTAALNAISGWTCNPTTGNVAANSMVGGNAEIVFYDSEYDTANKIPCDTAGKTLANVRKIKSTGTYAGTVRAIEMAVAVTANAGCRSLSLSSTIHTGATLVNAVKNCTGDEYLPTFEELACFIGDGSATNERLWTRTQFDGLATSYYQTLNLSTAERTIETLPQSIKYRCVKYIGS